MTDGLSKQTLSDLTAKFESLDDYDQLVVRKAGGVWAEP